MVAIAQGQTYQPPDFWRIFGHSYMQYNFGTRTQAGRADAQLRSALDVEFTNFVNHAVNGARLSVDSQTQGGFARILQNVTGSQNGGPYVAQGGASLLCFGINDLGFNTDTSQFRTNFQLALRAAISRCRMSTRRDDDYSGAAGTGVITYGAGFTSLAFTNDYSSGPTSFSGAGWSTLRQATSTTNATVTITLPTDYKGEPICINWIANAGAIGGTITYSGTAGVTGTTSTSNIVPTGQLSRSVVPFRITNLTAANAGQTIICTVTALDASGNVFFDGYWIESQTPPPVLVCNIAKLTSTGYAVYTVQPTDTQVDTWNNVITGVVAEFDSMVQLVDVDSAIDKANLGTTTLSFDGLHPTEWGAARIADAAIRALRKCRPSTVYGPQAHFNPQSARSAAVMVPYVPSQWYTTPTDAGNNGTAYAPVVGDVFAIPFFVCQGQQQAIQWSLERIAATAAPTVFFAIFDDRQYRGYPQYMHAQPANGTALSIGTGAGVFTSTTTSGQNGYLLQPLDPGLYWLALKIATAGTSATLRTLSGQSPFLPNCSTTGGGNVSVNGWKLTGQGATAFSGMFPPSATAVNFSPMMGLKFQWLGEP
jgi:hypothetical protein